jgi:ubiquinone/menaquinone biosynthesis C-methylase UbiE
MPADFSTVTELPGSKATTQQRSMLYTRYHFAREHCIDKDVLEVACGSGFGLGFLAGCARSVTGGDIDETNLNAARRSYQGRPQIRLHRQDAEQLDSPDSSFDTLLMFEAIYYLPSAAQFIREAQRVLRPRGTLLICSVNRRWQGFNRSPHSTQYFNADELRALLEAGQFVPQLYGAFPDRAQSTAHHFISAIRSFAIRFRLIPRTMKGKQWLKRLFYGRLVPLEPEVHEQMAPLEPLVPLAPGADTRQFRVLYAVGHLKKPASGNIAA